MVIPQLLEQILVALAIGALIGVERERLPKRKFFGTRTAAILSLGGPISVKLTGLMESNLPVYIYLALGAVFSVFLIYIRLHLAEKELGLTTSASVFILTLTSVLVGYSHYFLAIAIGITMTFLLAGKRKIEPYVSRLSEDEIIDALKVGAAAFIIYPLLPSEPVTSLGLINPRKILLFILLVLGIRFVAFVASRQLSEDKGLPLIGLLGGGVSSLATVGALSNIAEEETDLRPVAFAVVLAAVAMVIRNISIVTISSAQMGEMLLLPGAAMVIIGLIPSIYGLKDHAKSKGEEIREILQSPLSFRPALELGFYFLVITLVGEILKGMFGQSGLIAVAFFGGLVSSAAVAVSVISMLSSQTVTASTASVMIIVACVSSIIIKMGMVITAGDRDIIKNTLPFFVLMAIAGLVAVLML